VRKGKEKWGEVMKNYDRQGGYTRTIELMQPSIVTHHLAGSTFSAAITPKEWMQISSVF
jgi:hypothetical protein